MFVQACVNPSQWEWLTIEKARAYYEICQFFRKLRVRNFNSTGPRSRVPTCRAHAVFNGSRGFISGQLFVTHGQPDVLDANPGVNVENVASWDNCNRRIANLANLVPNLTIIKNAELDLMSIRYLKRFGDSKLKNSITWVVQLFDLIWYKNVE